MPPRTRGAGKTCAHQDCKQPIAPWYELCQSHNADKQSGLIDQCLDCGQYKDPRYPRCRECNAKAPMTTPKRATPKRSGKYDLEENPAWDKGDADADEFFVYILKLSDGEFYAGQTRELRERLDEHRDGKTLSTSGKDPKLVWFTTVSTRDEAVKVEAELKEAVDRNERQIRRMVRRFRDLLAEVDRKA